MAQLYSEMSSLLSGRSSPTGGGIGANFLTARHGTITKLSSAAKRVVREDEFEDIEMYVASFWRRIVFFIVSTMMLQIPFLILRNNERTMIKMTHRRARYGDDEELVVLVKRPDSNKWILAHESQLVEPVEIRAFLKRIIETQSDILGDSEPALVKACGDQTTMHGLVFEVQYRRYVLVEVLMHPIGTSQPFLFDQVHSMLEPDDVWILSRVEGSFAPPTDELFEQSTAEEATPDQEGVSDVYIENGTKAEESLQLKNSPGGLDRVTVQDRLVLYGQNELTVKVPSVAKLFLNQLLHPFFLFQLWAVVLWLLEVYFYYAVCILLTSLYSAFVEAREVHANKLRLAKFALEEEFVTVIRGGKEELISSRCLVPGDLMYVEAGMRMPCDGTLLSGNALANEASLTGESSPVRKQPWSPSAAEMNTDFDGSETSDADDDEEERDMVLVEFAQTHDYSADPESVESHTIHPSPKIGAAAPVKSIQEALQAATPSTTTWARSEHVLYCGTNILHANLPTLAVVIRTRADTVRGDLVRDILIDDASTESAAEEMHRDSYFVLVFLAVIGGFWTAWAYFRFVERYSLNEFESILTALDLVTIALPPALPATVTFGLVFAIKRLQKKRILVTRANAVTRAAWLNVLCFDKTGTLTEEGLDVRCLLPASDAKFHKELFAEDISSAPTDILRLMGACHALTSVDGKILGDEVDLKLFELSGWTLDDLTATEKVILRVRNGGERVEVKRLLDFDSELARMSVVAQWRTGVSIFTKGAPERIVSRCDKRSLPSNLPEVLTGFTEQVCPCTTDGERKIRCGLKTLDRCLSHGEDLSGFRVIALAERRMDKAGVAAALKQQRNQIERDLTFVGLVILENRLKEDTARVLQEVSLDAGLRSIMVTGDHARTALSVARQCGILPAANGRSVVLCELQKNSGRNQTSSGSVIFVETGKIAKKLKQKTVLNRLNPESPSRVDIVITGGAFRLLAAENSKLLRQGVKADDDRNVLFARILTHCSVFARMSAADKTLLVRLLKERFRLSVGMCGDGANDAGALREATVGVSLCGDEDGEITASLAAPLTSRTTTIHSVAIAIKEGRAAAAASLAALKYMFLYSVIQLFSVVFLYFFGSVLSDGQFLFVDLFLIIPLGVLMGQTHASPRLTEQKPAKRLTATSVLVSSLGHSGIMIFFQLVAIFLLRRHGLWLSQDVVINGIKQTEDLLDRNAMVTTIFLFVNFQYLWSCLVFNLGYPFRNSMTSNRSFTVTMILISAVCMVLLWIPPTIAKTLLSLVDLPISLKRELVVAIVMNLVACFSLEVFVNRKLTS